MGTAWAQSLPEPLTDADFLQFDPLQAELGQLLFYDKLLSGNRNISCGTCHHPAFGSSDGLSLGLGEGGVGLGPDRTPGIGAARIERRVPRNAPALWNLGAKDIMVLMHDGRISRDNLFGNGFNTPAEEWLPQGLNSILAAQALFPVTSHTEMAGQPEENEVAGAVNDRIDYAWPILAKRVRGISEYRAMFVAAFDHIESPEHVSMVDIANALAAFVAVEFRSHNSRFDHYLAGDDAALSDREKQGMTLFFGKAGCSGCHAGPLLSDQGFHALSLPSFGPGRTRRFDLIARDVGRMGESDRLEDMYRFRTPMLRNVELTAPYGHNGAYPSLEDMVRHHLDPQGQRSQWSQTIPVLPDVPELTKVDFIVQQDQREMERQQAAVDIQIGQRSEEEIGSLVAFLKSLTDTSEGVMPFGIPNEVPSGLPVDLQP